MSTDSQLFPMPEGWKTSTIGKVLDRERARPRRISSENGRIPFVPMALLPEDAAALRTWELRRPDEIRSGVQFFAGDVLLAKITPCLENGKLAVVRDLPGEWGMTSTEVLPLTPSMQVTSAFLAFFLAQAEVRNALASTMQGATGRQRLPKEALENFPITVPPMEEQRAMCEALRAAQEAKEACERVIAAARQLKASLLKHLFTYGVVAFDQGDQVPLHETETGLQPEAWKADVLGNFVTLQRGYDLPKQERKAGNIPIVSSAGISGYHNFAKVKGPGVVTGRYGTLGAVHYVDVDFWPLNTTLFVKDFHGNNPKFVTHFLETINLPAFNDKTSVPGINRNQVHKTRVAFPPIAEQELIAGILEAVEEKVRAEEVRREALANVFHSMLHHLMSGTVRLPEFVTST